MSITHRSLISGVKLIKKILKSSFLKLFIKGNKIDWISNWKERIRKMGFLLEFPILPEMLTRDGALIKDCWQFQQLFFRWKNPMLDEKNSNEKPIYVYESFQCNPSTIIGTYLVKFTLASATSKMTSWPQWPRKGLSDFFSKITFFKSVYQAENNEL